MSWSRRRARGWLIASALVVVAAALGGWYWMSRVSRMSGPTFRQRLEDWLPVGFEYHQQLMHPPASSLAAFERAGRGEPAGEGVLSYPYDHGPFTPPHKLSLAILAEPFWLNEGSICLGFPNELGRWDVKRCHWQVGDWHLEYAKHQFLWSLRVRGPGIAERSLETVRRVAEAVLRPSYGVPAAGIAFELLNDDGQVVFGGHDTNVREGKLRNWRDDVTWYHDGEVVGFISPEVNFGYDFIEVDEQRMRSWLKPYFERFFWPGMRDVMLPSAPETEALDALEAGRETPSIKRLRGDDPRVEGVPALLVALRIPADSECLVFYPHPELHLARCRYLAGGWRIEQATTGMHRALWVRGVSEPSDARERAEQVAARLFGRTIELEVLGHHQGKTFGKEKGTPTDQRALQRQRGKAVGKERAGATEQQAPEREPQKGEGSPALQRAPHTPRWWVDEDGLVGFLFYVAGQDK